MVSILSIGYGRLHLVQTADWLCKVGVVVKLVCGWVPKNPEGWLVRLCSKIIGRNLSAGMKKRSITLQNGGEVVPCAWVDFFCNALFWLEHKICRGRKHGEAAALAWKIFGWQTKRHIKKIAGDVLTQRRRGAERMKIVFHVRSGAGHGGAIKLAHKIGVPVVVDHSIAHPAYMEKHLRPEYEENGAVFDLGTSSPFWRLIVEDCEWADALLVNSFFVRDTFIEQGYPAEKIKVVYLGTRPDFFGLRKVKAANRGERKLRLLFTGGFGFRKGAEYILAAVKMLMEKATVPFEMDVVGDYSGAKGLIERFNNHVEQVEHVRGGEIYSRVERVEGGEMDGCVGASTCSTRSAWLNKSPITFHGPVPQDDLKKFLAQADIYVFPSLAEGCACSGMEAMAAGLCVVATHEAGFPIEDGVNGCVVPGKNAEAVAEKIMWLMEHPDEIDRIGAAAAELIRTKFTWEQYAENVKKIYEELV